MGGKGDAKGGGIGHCRINSVEVSKGIGGEKRILPANTPFDPRISVGGPMLGGSHLGERPGSRKAERNKVLPL